MAQRILCIDPAKENCGIVIVSRPASVIEYHATLNRLDACAFVEATRDMARVLLELPPLRADAMEGPGITYWLLHRIAVEKYGKPNVISINPGNWKPVAEAKGWMDREYTVLEDQHQVDALCLYKFYCWRENASRTARRKA